METNPQEQELDSLSVFALSRWAALIEGVNLVAEACEDKGENFDTLNLEPLSLRKYVESTCDIFNKKIEQQHKEEQQLKFKVKGISIKDLIDVLFEEQVKVKEEILA